MVDRADPASELSGLGERCAEGQRMLSEGSLSDLLRVIHEPDDDRPWREVQYVDPYDVHRFLDLANRLRNPFRLSAENNGLLFRGQADSSWPLTPGLWRGLKSLDRGNREQRECALRVEYDSIAYFRARTRSLIHPGATPSEDDPGGWLTLMQHYGAPTRLLDWTTSLNVALYFAAADCWVEVREIKHDGSCFQKRENRPGVVWFFDHFSLRSWMCENGYEPHAWGQYAEVFKDVGSFVSYGLDHARPNMWPTFPDKPTDRMMAQSSIHLFSEMPLCDYGQIVGKALSDYCPQGVKAPPLFKLVIPASMKLLLREYLHTIGISPATLFPGLDGVGRSISEMVALEVQARSRASAPMSGV